MLKKENIMSKEETQDQHEKKMIDGGWVVTTVWHLVNWYYPFGLA